MATKLCVKVTSDEKALCAAYFHHGAVTDSACYIVQKIIQVWNDKHEELDKEPSILGIHMLQAYDIWTNNSIYLTEEGITNAEHMADYQIVIDLSKKSISFGSMYFIPSDEEISEVLWWMDEKEEAIAEAFLAQLEGIGDKYELNLDDIPFDIAIEVMQEIIQEEEIFKCGEALYKKISD